jgi:hypothetical protein
MFTIEQQCPRSISSTVETHALVNTIQIEVHTYMPTAKLGIITKNLLGIQLMQLIDLENFLN